MRPSPSAERVALPHGACALPPGFVHLPAARTLVCADVHLGYEDVVGAALPLWSTAGASAAIHSALDRTGALEIVFLGDAIHSTHMSAGAASRVREMLDGLRARTRVTIIAGNHEGRTRGSSILGETVERCERDGWLLLHGDRPPAPGSRVIIGHLHPSVHLPGRQYAPCFLAARDAIVVPALTPYGRGLDVMGEALAAALAPYNLTADDVEVVAVAAQRLYPFGRLSALRSLLGDAPRSPKRSSIT